ncbi:MAG: PAS domain S-box protein [Actinomycetota bacterium]|nr:PAS domain S-box protein [Actinomycetota bacterium]
MESVKTRAEQLEGRSSVERRPASGLLVQKDAIHQLNNLLFIVQASSHLLLDDLAENDTRRHHATEILKAGRRAETVLRNLQGSALAEPTSRSRAYPLGHALEDEGVELPLGQLDQDLSILNAAGEGICALHADGRTSFVNPAAAEMTGYGIDELVGRNWHALVHHTKADGSPYPEDECPVAASLREGSVQHVSQEAFWRKDGTSFPAEYTSTPITEDGRVSGAVIVFKDLTQHRRAEDVLRVGEEHFRKIFEEGPVGMALVGADGRLLRVNGAWRQMLGYSEQDVAQLSLEEITHPEDRQLDAENLRKLFSGELDRYYREKRYLTKDKKVVWVSLWASLIRDAQGHPLYGLGIVEDISERKTLEQQLRQAQKMEAVGRLAGGIAHDFNNLLFVIQNAARFVLDDLNAQDPKSADVKEILESAERASSLVRQLLAFSRKEVVRPRVVDLGGVVRDVEKLLTRTIGEDIRLVTRLSDGLWPTEIDPGHLEQVIMNLAVNARDAMPDGGVLTLETSNVVVDEQAAEELPGLSPGNYVRLNVSDTGCGMSPEVASRVFEPFFTTKPRGSGTGLGLATVYGIIKQAGGFIYVSSELGSGSSFHVYLPATHRPVTEPVAEPDYKTSRSSGETILVVEDEDAVRELVARMLSKEGYKVLHAASGEDALRIFDDCKGLIDLVVTDVIMPQMSGRELLSRMKDCGEDLKVLYMSGHSDQIVGHHGILELSDNYIPKPFTREQLLSKVRGLLEAPERTRRRRAR